MQHEYSSSEESKDLDADGYWGNFMSSIYITFTLVYVCPYVASMRTVLSADNCVYDQCCRHLNHSSFLTTKLCFITLVDYTHQIETSTSSVYSYMSYRVFTARCYAVSMSLSLSMYVL